MAGDGITVAAIEERFRELRELTDLLDQTYGLMTAAERRFVEGVGRFCELDAYLEDGARSMVDWLCERYSMSRRQAAGLVAVASGLPALPFLASAYEKGDVSIDQLKAIVPVADEDCDAQLAADVPGWSEAQCRVVAARMRRRQEKAGEVHRTRFLRWFHRDERFVIEGELSTADGAVVEEAIGRLADATAKNDETGHFEPYPTRAADALVQLCSGSLGEAEEKEADVATVVCHVDPLTLAGFDGEAELDGARQIAAETARRLLCDCRFQIVKENANGEVIGLGRTTRVVPSWLRRVLRQRDGGCRWPGCPHGYWVDRHHIAHWAAGGTTDPSNLVQLCRRHHRVVHEEGWRIEGDPAAELSFISPAGRAVTSTPAPPRRELLERFGLWRPPGGDGPKGGHSTSSNGSENSGNGSASNSNRARDP